MKQAVGKRKTKTFGDDIIDRLTELVEVLERKEPIAEHFACRKVARSASSAAIAPQHVKRLRRSLRVSQTLFAKFLGVSASTVRAWEQGSVVPNDMACRFMDEIARDPQHWAKRFSQLVERQ